ncbi:glycosyltransferase family 2 protein [Hymenobacter psychrotolerans]|uniref:Glycosyl transferase family 2 n=1 Tax=Hymenobacter psychrotolerans DSM 18569 TaxID=1121959 RepID=A0A1M6V4L5_9BACT|nr:glycosyltransferase [Hymenobacter psychrotolerans]SHK76311.1 Glycosyl transferase family 2 [Hymenobacter psychrotolerans DSM 18569]
MNSPGLSVLIPVYNRDVTPLVHALLDQAAGWPGTLEIHCLDDGSKEALRLPNRALAALPGVCYQELPCNVGRAAIRNQLAGAAKQEWLLLLDNDSLLPDAQFLARYAAACHLAPVLVGGTAYEPAAPAATELHLRWLYGRRREARPAALRQRAPHGQLALNNMLVRADLFRRFGLDESLTRYGHEDTKFGWLLRQAGVEVLHLDNPVLHDGLEPAAQFLQKTHDAVRNLAGLYRAEGLGADTKLLKAALQLHRWGLGEAVRGAFQLRQQQVRRNLLSAQPSLRQLDALKLYWLLTELK